MRQNQYKRKLVAHSASQSAGQPVVQSVSHSVGQIINIAMNREGNQLCRTFKLNLGPLRLNFNPVVTFLSAVIIWTFVGICIGYPDESLKYMKSCKAWITKSFTWFYIGNVNVWLIFIIVVYFSKYGNMKLGKDDDKPEFSDASYFTMLFAAGIGVGFFYFGVAEPIYHYEPSRSRPYGNRYWGK